MFVFVTGVGIPPPIEFGGRICSDMHFWGSCGVLKVAMAQLEISAGYSDICFWYICLGICLPLLLVTSHFYLAQFWCSCGNGFFSEFVFFNNDGGMPTTLATQFLNGAGAVAGTGIIQLENVVFFQCMRTQDISKIFLSLLR